MKKVILIACVMLLVVAGCGGSGVSDNNVTSRSTAQQFATPTPSPVTGTTPVQQQSRGIGDVEVIATRANLRVLPKASGDVVKELVQGDQLTLLSDGAVGAWYSVRDLSSGKSGWIHGKGIRIASAAQLESSKAETKSSASEAPAKKKENVVRRSADTYTNVDGVQVPRPRKSATVPSGASAKCRDGTYSFSRHRQGTCSHHGGVAEWL